jgi:hypothetical protein
VNAAAQFFEDVLEVLVDGSWAQAEDLADIALGLALGDPRQHLGLARCQRGATGHLR